MVSLDTKDGSDLELLANNYLCILQHKSISFRSGSIDQSIIDKEQELITEELKNSGKPDDIAKKLA